jgi:di/tricarboxylate transporter
MSNSVTKPRIKFSDLVAGVMLYLGLLMLIVSVHLVAINSAGQTKDTLDLVFTILISLYSGAVVLGIALIVAQLLRYMAWSIETADWEKKQQKNGGQD